MDTCTWLAGTATLQSYNTGQREQQTTGKHLKCFAKLFISVLFVHSGLSLYIICGCSLRAWMNGDMLQGQDSRAFKGLQYLQPLSVLHIQAWLASWLSRGRQLVVIATFTRAICDFPRRMPVNFDLIGHCALAKSDLLHLLSGKVESVRRKGLRVDARPRGSSQHRVLMGNVNCVMLSTWPSLQ